MNNRLFKPPLFVLLFLLPVVASADPAGSADLAREWRKAHEQEIVDGFARLFSIPNVASDTVNIKRNAQYISQLLVSRGFDARLLETEVSPPAVFAELKTP